MDQVGGVVEEPLSLVESLVHEKEVALLQVAQPAVDQLGGPGGGAGCEVPGLDQGGAEASRRGVEGDSATGDAATYHEHVEVLRTEALQGPRTVERARRHGRPRYATRRSLVPLV